MKDIQNSIKEHIQFVDQFFMFNSFSEKNLVEWLLPLISSITDDGAIPYLLGEEKGERYRASPLASVLIWMNAVGLLPDTSINILQERLLFLRDNCEPLDNDKGNSSKKSEDNDGWSMAEGVSVWSTSYAIVALLDNRGIGVQKAHRYKNSVLWLAKQKKTSEKGWGYQLSTNCTENVIMTSLATWAIALVLKNRESFHFNEDEERLLTTSLTQGFEYLKEKVQYTKSGDKAFWCFDSVKSCAATTWALVALKYMADIDFKSEMNVFYNETVQKGIDFILGCMPNKSVCWEAEQVVSEAGAKYNKQKNYYSFSPTLLLPLFEIGLSPFHPKVINQISWLLDNTEGWKIEQYDRGNICSFTYAMVISTIAKWKMLVGQDSAIRLLHKSKKIADKFLGVIYGMPNFTETNVQVVSKHRIAVIWFFSVFIIFLAFKGKYFWNIIVENITKILVICNQSMDSIIINILSSFVYAGLVILVPALLAGIAKIYRRFIN